MPEDLKIIKRLNWRKKTMSASSAIAVVSQRTSAVAPAETKAKAEFGGSDCRLSEMRPGQTGTVSRIHSKAGKELQKFLALGVLPGSIVTLKRRFPSFVFEVGFSEYAVDNRIADAVLVRIANTEDAS
jgi:Fe2+ transport system protein FeoA